MAVVHLDQRMIAALMIVMAIGTLIVERAAILRAGVMGGSGMALRAGEIVPAGMRAENGRGIGKKVTRGMRLVAGFAIGIEGGVRVGEFAVRMGGDGPAGKSKFDDQPAEHHAHGRQRHAVLPAPQWIGAMKIAPVPGEPVDEIAAGRTRHTKFLRIEGMKCYFDFEFANQ
jgi:hypothetical protein